MGRGPVGVVILACPAGCAAEEPLRTPTARRRRPARNRRAGSRKRADGYLYEAELVSQLHPKHDQPPRIVECPTGDLLIWFYHHVLECDDALVGVRLSFVLGEWVELGGKYPPARDTATSRSACGRQTRASRSRPWGGRPSGRKAKGRMLETGLIRVHGGRIPSSRRPLT
jgi:hypothetical protein